MWTECWLGASPSRTEAAEDQAGLAPAPCPCGPGLGFGSSMHWPGPQSPGSSFRGKGICTGSGLQNTALVPVVYELRPITSPPRLWEEEPAVSYT